MKKLFLLLAAVVAVEGIHAQSPTQEIRQWQKQADGITIIRDDWGIAHIYGKTDADAVFGMVSAQAEDDFNRVETNYITNLSLLATAEGERRIYNDLRARIYCDPGLLKAEYAQSPERLKALMDAWAAGYNFYLYKHPEVKPRVITRFEPWMALSFTEGSIGGDLGHIQLGALQAFYGNGPVTQVSTLDPPPNPLAYTEDPIPVEPAGSNGIAIGPSNTANHNALLLINPHTSHYFRAELQMASDEGLNAYGAVTWGQFFIYQGFNANAGWMHTTSAVDDIDDYLETVTKQGDHFVYRYGTELRPVGERTITVPYKDGNGRMAEKSFTLFSTHHGPVVGSQNGKWLAVRMMNEHIKALQQSYDRTKARDFSEFEKIMDEFHTNSSNNTIFADSKGDIAYFHGNFIPRRDPGFDWTRPVDGSNPATEWNGLLGVEESPFLHNPPSGWLYNSNNSPWSAAGPSSPKQSNYPRYVDSGNESDRGRHAVRILSSNKNFTLDGLVASAYDNYQLYFESRLPPLIKAWDDLPEGDALKARVAEQIAMLRSWNLYSSVSSIPTSLAIFWAAQENGGRRSQGRGAAAPPDGRQIVEALAAASDRLTSDFGTWRKPWGEINRFQRLDDAITPHFDDAQPSIPIGWTSATQGSLASFAARAYPNTKKWYGTSGNSFVAVVEFAKDRVTARAITAGGESGDVHSKHFSDQAARFAAGDLRPVYYYRNQLTGHTERTYHPGQ